MANPPPGILRAFYSRPYLLLVLCMLCWAGNIVIMRASAGHVPPMALSLFRWSLACLLFLPMTWPHLKQDWPAIRSAVALLILLSMASMAIPNQMTLWALNYTTALNALLLQSVMPLLIALWALILFRDRLTRWELAGIAISMAGVAVIICQGRLDILLSVKVNPGDVMLFGAQIIFAFYCALTKKRPAIHPFSFLWVIMAMGAVTMAPLTAGEYALGYRMQFDARTVGTVLYLTVFGSVVALLLFNRAIELVGPNRTGPFMNLTPVFGSALAIVFLGERLQLFHAAGYLLVLIGLYVGTRR